MKIILKNWFLLTAGLILTATCVKVAYQERGYIAFGGEWLIIPLLFIVKEIIKSTIMSMMEDIFE